MPGDIGLDVPSKSTFTIEDIDRKEAPTFRWRKMPHITNYLGTLIGGRGDVYMEKILNWATYQRVGTYTFNNSSFRLDNKEFDHYWWETINEGFGGNPVRSVNTNEIKKAYQQHPEWFAMDDKGNRPYPRSPYYKLETTNPELVKWFAQQAVNSLKKNEESGKRPIAYSLSPSDGSGWSQSPESKALYDPPISNIVDSETSSGQPITSSLVLKWYHDVAQEVQKLYPQGRLAGYIYSSFVFPPVKVEAKLPDNFTPVLCGIGTYGYGLYREDNQKRWESVVDSWAKVAPENWFYYDLPAQFTRQERDGGSTGYSRFEGGVGTVMPAAPEILNRIFHKIDEVGIKGALIYSTSAWSGNAMNNYITAKMMWNPQLDAHEVQKEWLHRAYGTAAGKKMEIFHHKLNDIFREEYQKHNDYGHRLTTDTLKTVYGKHYAELEKLFLAATRQPMTAIQKKRLDMIEQNLIVLQWRLRNMEYLSSNFQSPLQRSDARIADIIDAVHSDINYFPGVIPVSGARDIPTYNKAKIKRIRFVKKELPEKDVTDLLHNKNTFLIRTTTNQQVHVVPRRVNHSATFATYVLRAKNAPQAVLKSGLLVQNSPITFDAKAGQDYYLYVVPRLGTGYELQFKDAALIERAEFDNKTGTLLIEADGPSIRILGNKMMSRNTGKDVTVATPLPLASLRKDYNNSRLVNLTKNWKFLPVKEEDQNYSSASFDDTKWDDINAGGWWQMQEEKYEKYNGAAWYRKKLDLSDLRGNEKAILHFGAVDGNADIYLNGKKLGSHLLSRSDNFFGWDQPFYFDITNVLRSGKNTFAVRVENKGIGASGIQGEVNLLIGVPIMDK